MKQQTVYLIVKADGSMTIHQKRRTLDIDQVGFPVTINWPDGWAAYREGFTVTMPEPPSIEAGA